MYCLATVEFLIFAEIAWIIDVAYLLLRDALFQGRSIGKYIVGLWVVQADGQPCTVVRSALRNVIFLLPMSFLVEYVVMRFSREERRLGDLLAKTKVIDLRPQQADGQFLLISLAIIIIGGAILVAVIDVPPQVETE